MIFISFLSVSPFALWLLIVCVLLHPFLALTRVSGAKEVLSLQFLNKQIIDNSIWGRGREAKVIIHQKTQWLLWALLCFSQGLVEKRVRLPWEDSAVLCEQLLLVNGLSSQGASALLRMSHSDPTPCWCPSLSSSSSGVFFLGVEGPFSEI